MAETTRQAVTWETGGPYPPAGIYRLTFSDGAVRIIPMTPDWVWDDTWHGAKIDLAERLPDEAAATL